MCAIMLSKEEIVNLYIEDGLTIRQIGELCGLKYNKMRDTMVELQIPIKSKYYKNSVIPKIKNKVTSLYQQGLSANVIAEQVGLSQSGVLNILHREGIEIKKRKQYDYRRYKINDTAFSDISTPEQTYWLGFLATDGNLVDDEETVQLCLGGVDIDHLYKYKKFLGADHPITERVRFRKDKEYKECYFTFRSRKIWQDLNKLGITPRKTKTLKWLDFNDKELDLAFIRGCMDGDGCYCLKKSVTLGLTSASEDFIENYYKTLHKYLKLDTKSNTTKKITNVGNYQYNYVIGNRSDIRKIISELYSISGDYLERKYQKIKDNNYL